MLDVIEHLRDPAETVRLLVEALAPRGLLVITTGDWGSLCGRLMGRHWRLMTPPQHLFFFSKSNLAALGFNAPNVGQCPDCIWQREATTELIGK